MKMLRIKDLLKSIEYVAFEGDDSIEIQQVVPITEIENIDNAISWCSDKNSDYLKNIHSLSLVVVSNTIKDYGNLKNYLIVKNPRRTFQEILTLFFLKKRAPSISKTAYIANNVTIGKDVYIGHNVVIEEGCIIEDYSVIFHNTTILKDTIIGKRVTVGSNSTIGGVGFGYEKNAKGDFELIPHLGNVVIKDNVDIGNNTCIDRAVLGSTILEYNVKVDNLVHIAHGVKIGENSVVIANAMIAGSTNIGENSWISPSASILNKINIGANTLVGMGSVVIKNVGNYSVVAGNPSKFIKAIEK